MDTEQPIQFVLPYLDMFSINGIIEDIQWRQYGKPEERKELVEFNIRRLKQSKLRFVCFKHSLHETLKQKYIEEKDYVQVSFRIDGREYNDKIYVELICDEMIMVRPDRNKKNFKGFEIPGTKGYEKSDGILVGGSLKDQVDAARQRKKALEELEALEGDETK